jgi:hypothetical protein
MRGFKILLCATALLASLVSLPTAKAQIRVGINLDVPPVCSYGYYDYAPYACAPVGFYGPGYFYNGIFLGVGPWANWGYRHGWGGHRFAGGGGGRYQGGGHPVGHAEGHPGGGHPMGHPAGHPGGGGHPGPR